MSLASVAPPCATDPNTRTFLAPCFSAIRRISSRFSRTRSSSSFVFSDRAIAMPQQDGFSNLEEATFPPKYNKDGLLKPTDASALVSPRELRRYRPADEENVKGVKTIFVASRVPAYLAVHEPNFPSTAWPKLSFRKRLPTPFPAPFISTPSLSPHLHHISPAYSFALTAITHLAYFTRHVLRLVLLSRHIFARKTIDRTESPQMSLLVNDWKCRTLNQVM